MEKDAEAIIQFSILSAVIEMKAEPWLHGGGMVITAWNNLRSFSKRLFTWAESSSWNSMIKDIDA